MRSDVKASVQWAVLLLFSSIFALTTGCSGGGGSSTGAGAQAAAAKTVTGVAATGAPIAGGTVWIKDSSASPVERQQQTASDGSFSFIAADLKPPFMLKAASTAATQNLYSVATDYGMTNITPLTTIVVAQASQRDDLDALYTNLNPAEIAAVSAQMTFADTTVQNTFAPLMSAFNVQGSLVFGRFEANGKGLDALLDAVAITVAPGSISVTQKNSGTLLLETSATRISRTAISMSGVTPPVQPPPPNTGSELYETKCAGCHGAAGTSNLQGRMTIALTQSAITSNRGSMGMLSGLSTADVQAIYDYLSGIVPPAPVPPPDPNPLPTPTPTPTSDGTTLYSTYCAGCHGALAASSLAGTTASRIQNAISNNRGGMGYLSSLSGAQLEALAAVLSSVTETPAATQACGSCHAIPPPSGKHSKHTSERIGCVTCHGSGYSTTTFNAATHDNGTINIDTTTTKWNSVLKSCANACHSKETWSSSSSSDNSSRDDD